MDLTVRHSRGEYLVHEVPLERLFEGVEDANVITDSNVARHYAGQLGPLRKVLVVPAGEASKSFQRLEESVGWLARSGANRRSQVVAFGGGVVGDLAGFAAATFGRGVPFVQIPTSLLAMVDSSVGGKVGIDLPEGKNLVGAFWPPTEVRLCRDLLDTLPQDEFTNGLAEIVKMGAILDRALFERLEGERLEPASPSLPEVIGRSIALKAQVVAEDEYETAGLRAILNFGHTVGHAIEAEQGYTGLKHGQAVAVGMVLEARLGEALGLTPPGVALRIRETAARQGLPVALPPGLEPDSLIAWMRRDKKALGQALSFSLLTGLGACKLVHGVDESLVAAVLGSE
ncbi:MAG: 3-dehydroquinate synthase [Fimbriimonadaceae bacterium]|nr:3-dehydroquinate synthase [Fimbriimonadaceae bacterium]QYK55853.1 MAG: 3-dehydroquinate synthase [Fimbriimonadaceae bacterium]